MGNAANYWQAKEGAKKAGEAGDKIKDAIAPDIVIPPPPEPPKPKVKPEKAATDARKRQTKRALNADGRSGTILTGGSGLGELGESTGTKRKTLLGH